MALTAAFIPLFLVTFLLISAGNLALSRLSASSSDQRRHLLPAWTVNSLLLVACPALFALLFIPSIIAGHAYTHNIERAWSA
ncbi:hypothetical protein JCM11641_004923 [Rhodosporidiobolus odoratus]